MVYRELCDRYLVYKSYAHGTWSTRSYAAGTRSTACTLATSGLHGWYSVYNGELLLVLSLQIVQKTTEGYGGRNYLVLCLRQERRRYIGYWISPIRIEATAGNGRRIKHTIECSTWPKYCQLWSGMKLGKLRSIDHILMGLNDKGKRASRINGELKRRQHWLREGPFSNQQADQVRDWAED